MSEWAASECVVPFLHVASYNTGRRPSVEMNPDPKSWVLDRGGKINWLMGSRQEPSEWKVKLEFIDPADALLFKLTFGGA